MIKIKTITEDLVTFINTLMTTKGRTINIYPEAAFEGTQIPFLIYRRTNIDDTVSKDGVVGRSVTFDIDVVTSDYITGVEIMDDLTEAIYYGQLVGTSHSYERRMVNITETMDAENNLFVQTITFTIEAY